MKVEFDGKYGKWSWTVRNRRDRVVAISFGTFKSARDAKKDLFGFLNAEKLEITGYPMRGRPHA